MKKLVIAALALVFCVCLSVNVFANDDVDSIDRIRANMIMCGIPEDVVSGLPASEIEKYVNITPESVEKHYYKITESNSDENSNEERKDYAFEEVTESDCVEAIEAEQTRGTIGASYLSVTISTTHLSGRNYEISAAYQWLTIPIFQLTDYLALTIHDSMVLVPDTEYTMEQNDYVSIYSGSTVHTNSWEDSLYASGVGGHCMAIHWIPSDDYTTYFNFRGYIGFEARIAQVGQNGIVHSAAYITYAHQTLVPAFNVSVSLNMSVSASISPAISFDFMTKQKSFTYYE